MLFIIKKNDNTQGKKRLLENFLSLSVLQIFSYILPLITLPYLVRVLGVDRYGLVIFAQSIIVFFNIIVDYGFSLSATREIAVNRENKEKVTEIYSSVMIIKVFLLVLSFFVFCLAISTFDRFSSDANLYLMTFLMVVGQALFPIWYFQGMERMKYITFINLISRIVFAVAIFLFVHQESDYMLVPFLNGMGACIGSICSLLILKSVFKQSFKWQSYKVIASHFKDSTRFFLSRIAVSIYTSANAVIIGLFTNNTMVGYYSIAEKIYGAIQALYGPINQALYPYVAKERNVTFYKKLLLLICLINASGVLIAYLFGGTIFSILFDKRIGVESIEVFHIFLLANLFAVPSVLIGYPFLAALGHTRFTNNSVIISALYHIVGLVVIVVFQSVTVYSVSILFVTTAIIEFSIRVFGIRKYGLWKLG